MPFFRYRSIFFGQILMGLWLHSSWPVPMSCLAFFGCCLWLRGWEWLNFCAGGLWQLIWTPDWNWQQPWLLRVEAGGRAGDNFLWILGAADPAHDPFSLGLDQGFLKVWSDTSAAWVRMRLLTWDSRWGPWFLQFAFGMSETKSGWFIELYRQLGLLHVLVVSGAHFSFLGRWAQLGIEGPGRLLYALRLLPYKVWQQLLIVSRLLLTFVMIFYGMIVGFNPPCQRALIALVLGLWLPLIAGPKAPSRVDLWVMCGQALCFPNSFLSISNALSWSAYALMCRLKPWPKVWQRKILPGIEGPMITVNLAYFGFFSPIGVILNPLLGPVWHLLLGLGIGLLIWPDSVFAQWLRLGLEQLHQVLGAALRWQDLHQGAAKLAFAGASSVPLRACLWLAASWALLRLWRDENPPLGA